jgi:hypothetical protein
VNGFANSQFGALAYKREDGHVRDFHVFVFGNVLRSFW